MSACLQTSREGFTPVSRGQRHWQTDFFPFGSKWLSTVFQPQLSLLSLWNYFSSRSPSICRKALKRLHELILEPAIANYPDYCVATAQVSLTCIKCLLTVSVGSPQHNINIMFSCWCNEWTAGKRIAAGRRKCCFSWSGCVSSSPGLVVSIVVLPSSLSCVLSYSVLRAQQYSKWFACCPKLYFFRSSSVKMASPAKSLP